MYSVAVSVLKGSPYSDDPATRYSSYVMSNSDYLLLEGEDLEDGGHCLDFSHAETLEDCRFLINDLKDAFGLTCINVGD